MKKPDADILVGILFLLGVVLWLLRWPIIVLIVVLLILGALPAEAQARFCGQRATVIERLADGWGERRQSIGLTANNSVMEMYANTETGTWTATVTHPNGVTCLVASGTNYETVSDALPGNL